MKNEEFERLLDLYLKGRLSATEKARLEQQLEEFQHPNKQHHEFNSRHADDLWKKIAAKTVDKERKRRSWIPIAAGIAIVAATAILTLFWKRDNLQLSNKLILNDGSIVWLKDNAILDQSRLTPSNRQVSLQGEALFEVAKDPQHPFIIHCGKYIARVLGTSFNLHATDSAIELTVLTGQVKISALLNDSSIIVHPREHIVFKGDVVNKTNSEQTEIISLTRNTEYDMRFEDTKMDEIVRRVEAKFDVNIKLEDVNLRNCMISADLTDQSLANTLDMISEALGVHYTIDRTRITISGIGCK